MGIGAIRNLFDQYSQPENRLTHALMSSIHEDRALLGELIEWAIGRRAPVQTSELTVLEQSLPGEEAGFDPDVAERRGLPDGCIHDESGWALLIESKIAANLTENQLQRHLSSADRHGLKDVTLLALVANQSRYPEMHHLVTRKWTELYVWLKGTARNHQWAARLGDYMEILEARLVEEAYLKEGTLTVFTGIPFGKDRPYNYLEAKRALLLAMDELRSRKDLARELGVDQSASGRPAITGKDSTRVWDFLRLARAAGAENFTEFPHLTTGIHREYLNAIITVPNGIRRDFRRNLLDGGFEAFRSMFASVLSGFDGLVRTTTGVVPWIEVLQRHYRTQRSEPTIDARLDFDLRTAFEDDSVGENSVKMQLQWLDATYQALTNKKSNIQIGVGARFWYEICPAVNSSDILDHIAHTWMACKPLIQKMLR